MDASMVIGLKETATRTRVKDRSDDDDGRVASAVTTYSNYDEVILSLRPALFGTLRAVQPRNRQMIPPWV